jgi:hypothetical protein
VCSSTAIAGVPAPDSVGRTRTVPASRSAAQTQVVTMTTSNIRSRMRRLPADHEAIAAYYNKEAADNERRQRFTTRPTRRYEAFNDHREMAKKARSKQRVSSWQGGLAPPCPTASKTAGWSQDATLSRHRVSYAKPKRFSSTWRGEHSSVQSGENQIQGSVKNSHRGCRQLRPVCHAIIAAIP